MSIDRWMDKEVAGHINNVILHACVLSSSVTTDSLWPRGLQPSRLLCPWDFPGKNTGVGCYFLLQGIFLTQGSNPNLLGLLHHRQILYHWAMEKPTYIQWNIYSAIKKEWTNTICSNMNGPRMYHTKWSKSENKYHLEALIGGIWASHVVQ